MFGEEILEAVAQACSVKKMFLEILQNSQENTRTRVSILIKLQAWGLQLEFCKILFVKTVSFVKFLRTPFPTEHLWWLLLKFVQFTVFPLIRTGP